MFLQLLLNCVQLWATELSPKRPQLSKFSEKYSILKNARIDFPDHKLYRETFAYIVGGFSATGVARVSLPGNPEESVSHSKFDESTFVKVSVQEFHDPVLPSTVLRSGKEMYAVDREIQEVLPSEEYSHIEHANHLLGLGGQACAVCHAHHQAIHSQSLVVQDRRQHPQHTCGRVDRKHRSNIPRDNTERKRLEGAREVRV